MEITRIHDVRPAAYDEEIVTIEYCPCGHKFTIWDFTIPLYPGVSEPCPTCGKKFSAKIGVTLYEVHEPTLKACKTCHGRGFQISGGDSVDYGSMTTRLPTYPEPCEDCTGHGLCPSCGWAIIHESESDENFEAWWDNPTACPNPECGWEPTEIKNF